MKNDVIVKNGKVGVLIKETGYFGIIPVVAGGAGESIGSDWYGYEIKEVAEDLTWFKYGNKYAKFDHRKNSIHCGRYVEAYMKDGKLKYVPTCHSVRCEDMNLVHVSRGVIPTQYDPSF